MDAIVCPKCGTENPGDAMNCKHCKINLRFALEHPEQIETIQLETSQREENSTPHPVSKGTKSATVFALLLLLVCGFLWCVTSLWLTPPQFGPCAYGGEHYETYLSLVQYWTLHLVLGYIVVVARIFEGTRPQDKGTVELGMFLNIAIGVWVVVAIWIWIHIFSRLCV